jgi:predicted transcriptional regulator
VYQLPSEASFVDDQLTELTADIVSAFVSHNSVSVADLPRVIADVHAALNARRSPPPEVVEEQKPAVSVRRSVTPDYLICLEDGKKFKSLKRHLRTQFDLSPAEYREKWNLPSDYPMVAPNYSATRSQLARENGLGRKLAPARSAPKGRKARTSAR